MADNANEKQPSKECLLEIFETALLSDVTVKFGDAEVRAHKTILAEKPQWFKQKFQRTYKNSAVLDIRPRLSDDQSPEYKRACQGTLEAVIRFCYVGEYSKIPQCGNWTQSDMCCAVHEGAYLLARYFGIESLAQYSKQKYSEVRSKMLTRLSVDKAFEELAHPFKAKDISPHRQELHRAVALQDFECRIKKYREARLFENALKRMEQNPLATIEIYKKYAPSQDEHSKPQAANLSGKNEWTCSNCKTAFFYDKKSYKRDISLPSCPCCTTTSNQFLKLESRTTFERGREILEVSDDEAILPRKKKPFRRLDGDE